MGNSTPHQISQPSGSAKAKMTHAIRSLLELAEGIMKVRSSALIICLTINVLEANVAAVAYREIDRKLARNEYAFWKGRVVV